MHVLIIRGLCAICGFHCIYVCLLAFMYIIYKYIHINFSANAEIKTLLHPMTILWGWSSQGVDCEDYCLLACDSVYFGRWIHISRRNQLLPFAVFLYPEAALKSCCLPNWWEVGSNFQSNLHWTLRLSVVVGSLPVLAVNDVTHEKLERERGLQSPPLHPWQTGWSHLATERPILGIHACRKITQSYPLSHNC
jgi:hypothetical protein